MNESDKELLQAAGTAVRHLDCFNLKQELQGWLCKLAFRLDNPLSSPAIDEARHDLRLIASMGSPLISVEDALPKHLQRVICIYDGVYDGRVVTFWKDQGGAAHFGKPYEPDGKGSQPATHWMPLPAAPGKEAV